MRACPAGAPLVGEAVVSAPPGRPQIRVLGAAGGVERDYLLCGTVTVTVCVVTLPLLSVAVIVIV